MSTRVRDVMTSRLGELRHEPVARRVRAELGGRTVVDSTRAVLVWEPRRVVPSYGVPVEDVHAELVAGERGALADDSVGLPLPEVSRRPVLDPSVPFAVHSTDGQPLELRSGGAVAAAFRPADADLAGYVVLDFAGFDAWYDEDERIVSHPRDPFHRIDVLPSSRSVRLELGGELLAESERPRLLFETLLPTRFYLDPAEVRVPLHPSPTRTWCAYKGEASYWSAEVGGELVPDLVWGYPEPRHDAAAVAGLVCFFDERVDVVLDGVRRERPVTPWSPRR
ncbi:MAG TPA: DUF427 domain-containing protein [Mycobacteriales bacterium]|nr:DUF427 domain-containing protein [Mycobacteriales bacterium]